MTTFNFGTLQRDRALIDTGLEFRQAGVLLPPFQCCKFVYQLKGESYPYCIDIRGNDARVFVNQRLVLKATGLRRGELDFEPIATIKEKLTPEQVKEFLALLVQEYLQCLMLLNLPYYEQIVHEPTEKQQKKRAKKGKPPLETKITVRMRHEYEAYLSDENTNGGKKRPHWRRGHMRTLSNGKKTAVNPCMVNFNGDPIKPKDYVIKPAVLLHKQSK